MYGGCYGPLVTAVAGLMFAPRIAQSQERVLFVSDRDGNREIYAMRADGSHQTNLSQDPARDQAPAISPDGQTVAFVSDRSGAVGIWMMGIRGGNPRLIVELPEADFGLEWSPDGRTLALSIQRAVDRTHDIATLDVETARLRMLTDTEGVEELTPTWSPDGRRLYFVRDDGSGSTLVALNVAAGTTERVIPAVIGQAAFPKVSPDGRRVLLRSRDAEQFDVLLIDLESAGVENLTPHGANDWGAAWSRDGATIVFASDRDGDMEIYTLTLRTRDLRQLTRNETRDWMPVW